MKPPYRIIQIANRWSWEPIAGWDAIGIHLEWNQHGGLHKTRGEAEAAAKRACPRVVRDR